MNHEKEDDTIIMSRDYKLITFAPKRFGIVFPRRFFNAHFLKEGDAYDCDNSLKTIM